MRVLLVGGDSLIGNFLGRKREDGGPLASLDIEITLTTRRKSKVSNEIFLDLKLEKEFHFSEKWDSAVICAGFTNIRFCQDNQAEAELVNYSNTIKLIDSLIQEGSHIIFLSSNAIF
jgi:dTDP-4-dehydrorhamnose reductase